MVSLIIDSDVLDVVELPVRNCGTTGTASVLIGHNSKSNNQSLVNRNSNFSRSNTASTTASSRAGMNARTQ